jgi:hypothetical protein
VAAATEKKNSRFEKKTGALMSEKLLTRRRGRLRKNRKMV